MSTTAAATDDRLALRTDDDDLGPAGGALPRWTREAVAIVAEHRGAERAERLLADAVDAAARLTAGAPVEQCSGPTPADDVWSELWRAFAVEAPELFGPRVADVSPDARGISYAFLYVLHTRPEQLHAGLAREPFLAAELPTDVLDRVRRLPGLGVELPETPTAFWRVREGCVLHAYLTGHSTYECTNWHGLSLFNEPVVREHAFVVDVGDPAPTLDGLRFLEHLALHEHLHHAVAAALRPNQAVRLGRLTALTNEVAVELLTLLADGHRPNEAFPPLRMDDFVDRVNGMFYLPAVVGVLSRTGAGILDEPATILSLASASLDGDDERAAALLNELADDTATVDEWLARLGDADSTIRVVWPDGTVSHTRGLALHNDVGPAVERVDGATAWLRGGEYHREDGPALSCANGSWEWWRAGYMHREGAPAVRVVDGERVIWEWHDDGDLHREGGPAVEVTDGSYAYYRRGVLHREGGPAVHLADLATSGPCVPDWEAGHLYLYARLYELVPPSRHQACTHWYSNGLLHRVDGPAVEYASGAYEHHVDGLLHREDGPAVDDGHGSCAWYIDDTPADFGGRSVETGAFGVCSEPDTRAPAAAPARARAPARTAEGKTRRRQQARSTFTA